MSTADPGDRNPYFIDVLLALARNGYPATPWEEVGSHNIPTVRVWLNGLQFTFQPRADKAVGLAVAEPYGSARHQRETQWREVDWQEFPDLDSAVGEIARWSLKAARVEAYAARTKDPTS